MVNTTQQTDSFNPKQRSGFYQVTGESLVMIWRSLHHITRNIDLLIVGFLLPVTQLLLFVYVFGGAINTGNTQYVNYVVPGIILASVGYSSSLVAISVSTDMTVGLIDRFRSMPIFSASVLTGHVVASLMRNIISTILVIVVALLLGFRPTADPLAWLMVSGFLLLFMLAMSWLAAVFGLLAKSVEGANAFTFFVLFLPYISSAFVPTETMPEALRFFADNQPVTHVIEAIRVLTIGGSLDNHGWLAAAWCIGLTGVSYVLAVSLFEHRTAS